MTYGEQLSDVGGFRLRSVRITGKDPKVTVVFIPGASCSLLDPLYTFAALCPPDMAMIFVDRPGHGPWECGMIQKATFNSCHANRKPRCHNGRVFIDNENIHAFFIKKPPKTDGLITTDVDLSMYHGMIQT